MLYAKSSRDFMNFRFQKQALGKLNYDSNRCATTDVFACPFRSRFVDRPLTKKETRRKPRVLYACVRSACSRDNDFDRPVKTGRLRNDNKISDSFSGESREKRYSILVAPVFRDVLTAERNGRIEL